MIRKKPGVVFDEPDVGAFMPNSLRGMLALVAAAVFAGALLIGYRLTQAVTVQKGGPLVIRRPGLSKATAPAAAKPAGRRNLAPMATVSVSSIDSGNKSSEGVADDIPDSGEWISSGETSGAWIKLDWEKPVVVSEIELFDLPNPKENVLSGALVFDDGTSIAVPALPSNGAAWRIQFPAKTVLSLMFRIDRAQGHPGLAEIIVYGPGQ